MDRGGTITWYLTANDADFLATLRKARTEAKLAGDDIDKSLNRGSQGATQALKNLGNQSNSLTNSLDSTANRSDILRGSLSGLNVQTRSFTASIGGTALRGFTTNMGAAGNESQKASKKVNMASLSLDDFHRTIGRSASAFRNFQIALRGFQLNALILGGTLAVGALIQLAGAVTQLLGLLYAAPAAIGVFAAALSTLKVATSGIGDAFKALTKSTGGVSAASTLAKKQADLLRNSMKQEAALTRRMTDLTEQYSEVVQELAEERLQILNEQILKGVDAWDSITDSAKNYLDVSQSLSDLTNKVTDAQNAYNTALITYGPASQQALTAARDLYAAQANVADANSELDQSFASVTSNIKDLATNLGSLQKANRNEMAASLLNLKALRLDKQARGESITEITDMVSVLEDLISIKDTKLSVNPDLAGAQSELNDLKAEFPNIAIAASEASSSAENSLTKSLSNIADSMDDVRRQRIELQEELTRSMAEATDASSAGGIDPFEGLSKNARNFVIALKDVKDQFQPIKEIIQDNFFAGLDTEIRNLANTSFPMLQVGMGKVASSFNLILKEASRVAQEPFFQGAIAASFATTASAVDILKNAVEPLAVAFTNLMNIGNPYILMLADWIVKQSTLAAQFTSSKEGQDSINASISAGVDALGQIMSFLGSVIGLFTDLFKIGNDANVSILTTLTGIVDGMREWLKEGDNAQRIVSLFEAANTVIGAFADVIGTVVKGVLELIHWYNELDGPMKDIITNILVFSAIAGPVLGYIASQFSSLILLVSTAKEGLQLLDAVIGTDLTKSVSNFVGEGGKVSKLFDIIGKHPILIILGLIAAIFVYLGTQTTIFQDAFKALKPVFDEFFVALQPVFKVLSELGNVLGGALATILPIIAQIFGQVLAALLPLIPPILQLVMTLLPIFVTILQAVISVIQFLMPIITVLVQILGVILVAAVNIVVGILKLLVEAIVNVAKWFVDGWNNIVAIWNGAVQFFTDIWNGIVTVFTVVATWFGDMFKKAWEAIKTIWNFVVSYYQGIWNGIMTIFNVVATYFKDIFQKAWNGITNIWNNVSTFFSNIWNNIVNAFSGAMNLGGDIVRGLWNGISNAGSWIIGKIKGFGDSVLGGLKSFFGIKSPSTVMRDQIGMMLGLGIAGGIEDSTGEAVGAAKSAAEQITDAFTMSTLGTDFSVTADSMITSQFAPSVLDAMGRNSTSGTQAGVVINQTNEVYSDVDMEQVNRNLTWEMSKV